MTAEAFSSSEADIENIAEAGTAAAVLAFLMAVSRAIITEISGPYPEIFVGITGGIWWAICGAFVGMSICSAAAVAVMLLMPER